MSGTLLLNHFLDLLNHFLYSLIHFLRLLNCFICLLVHFLYLRNYFLYLLNRFIGLQSYFLYLLNHLLMVFYVCDWHDKRIMHPVTFENDGAIEYRFIRLLLNYHRQKYSVGINHHRDGRAIAQAVAVGYSQAECQQARGGWHGEGGADGTAAAKGDAHTARLHPRIRQAIAIRIAAARTI